jgi:cytochrome c551/c552
LPNEKSKREQPQMKRITLIIAFAVVAPAQQEPAAFVNQYCVGCHSTQTHTAGLDLQSIDAGNPAADSEVWEKVVRRLRARQMPPAGMPRPDESVYAAVVAKLSASLDDAAKAEVNPGRTDAFRRLNRTEYHNAVRDLLAVDVDVANLLPRDESSHGFDNITVGNLSPTLLERYIS